MGALKVLGITSRAAFSPVWLAWMGYKGLWWAFDDSDSRRAAGSATLAPHDAPPPPNPLTDAPRYGETQKAAFEVTDSTPAPAAPPKGPLMGGFVSTLAASGGSGLLASSFDEMSSGRAWTLWAWCTLMATVGSLYVVRHVARRQAEAPPTTLWGKCRTTAGGLKDACVGAGHGVGTAYQKSVHAAKVTRDGVQKVAASTPAQAAKRGVVAAWGALRKKAATSPTQTA